MKTLPVLFTVFIVSCTKEPNTRQTIKGSMNIPIEQERTISYSQAIQPENVTCPQCKRKGEYIHSFMYSDVPNLFFSKYTCSNNSKYV